MLGDVRANHVGSIVFRRRLDSLGVIVIVIIIIICGHRKAIQRLKEVNRDVLYEKCNVF